jgi:hypothetical protein
LEQISSTLVLSKRVNSSLDQFKQLNQAIDGINKAYDKKTISMKASKRSSTSTEEIPQLQLPGKKANQINMKTLNHPIKDL